jgi:hypothetical protein
LYNLINFLEKSKNKIIFLFVSIFAVQAFYIIFTLGVGHPGPDELELVPAIKLFLEGGPWWEDEWFLQHFEHRVIIPNFIFFISAALDQGNVIHQMYLGWIFLVFSIIILYTLLKKIDNNLTWLLIPISGFIFNVGQTTCFTWGVCSVAWYLTSFLIILTIFFISKIDHNKIALIFAIVSAILVSFTMFQGLLIWVVGGFGILFVDKMKKRSLAIWILSGVITIFVYFTNYNFDARNVLDDGRGIELHTLFTYEGISNILLFLSNGLIVYLPQTIPIQYIFGMGMILIIVFVPMFLKFKKIEIKNLIPWIQFGLYAILGALVLEIGRSTVVSVNASRYIAWFAFAHIAALVIGTIFLLYLYKKLKNSRQKLLFKIIISILIIFLILGVSSSAYSGLKIGNDLFEKNLLTFDCLRDSKFDLKCRTAYYHEDAYNNIKELQNLNLGVFAIKLNQTNDPLLENFNWKNMNLNINGFGEIKYVDSKFNVDRSQELKSKIIVDRNSSPIDMGGWGIFGDRDVNVDSAYVFVDNKVHSNAYYGYQTPSNNQILGEKTKPSYFAGIGGILILENLSDGCHDFSIRITHENEYYEIFSDSQICIKSNT